MSCKRSIAATAIAAAVFFSASPGMAQDFGVRYKGEPTAGYTPFSTFRGTSTYLIDNDGVIRNEWVEPDGYGMGSAEYLTEYGTLIKGVLSDGADFTDNGGPAGLIREYDWDGNVIWEFDYNGVIDTKLVKGKTTDRLVRTHHDIALLPNGNILALARELYSCADAIALGLDTNVLACPITNNGGIQLEPLGYWSDTIIEIKPKRFKPGKLVQGGKIVWKWDLIDHLSADNEPGKWNINNGVLNFNAIDYDARRRQILLSCNFCDEIMIVEHSKNARIAAKDKRGIYGKGGDFLYRWGNPANYVSDTSEPQLTFFQHGLRFVERKENGFRLREDIGDILVFNNQSGPGPRSSVGQFTPDRTAPYKGGFKLDEMTSTFGPSDFETVISGFTDQDGEPATFFSPFLSNPQRLPNGSTLILAGVNGEIFEIDRDGVLQWSYRNPAYSLAGGVASTRPNNGNRPANECVVGSPPPGANFFTFRANKYAVKFKGFRKKDLSPKGVLCEQPIDPAIAQISLN